MRRVWPEVRVVAVAVVCVLVVRVFVFPVFLIPSSSMAGTLLVGDRVVVSRIAMLSGGVRRGDVVVFRDSLGWLSDGQRSGYLVKRVVGVGGDRVSCCSPEGRVMVNGVPVREDYVDRLPAAPVPFDVTVPDGRLWVMGDNRGDSADSLRHWLWGDDPFVPVGDVVGPVGLVVWPLSRWRTGIGRREAFVQAGEAR